MRDDDFGAFDVPALPAYPAPVGTDWFVVALIVTVFVLGMSLVVWFLRSHEPGKGLLSGLVLLISFFGVLYATPYYMMWSQDRDLRARQPIDEVHQRLSDQGVPELAEWYGIFPVDMEIDYRKGRSSVIIEVDGWVEMGCYTLIREGRVGIACGPDPDSGDHTDDDLVELPRADERAAGDKESAT